MKIICHTVVMQNNNDNSKLYRYKGAKQ